MSRGYVIVAGDFLTTGGMDRANYELAWHLADRVGAQVDLVAHRVADPLAGHRNVVWHRVHKPLDSYLLAEPLLARHGYDVARRLVRRSGARVIVNGGNCLWGDVNWAHAVHAAWANRDRHAPLAFRARNAWSKARARRSERRALQRARLVVANSELARRQIVSRIGISPERVKLVYLGTDPATFRPPRPEERAAARRRMGVADGRPMVAFVGALGYDRNKGFDVLFAAWRLLCATGGWDADLIAAGGGAEVNYWRGQATAAGLSDRVRLLGATPEVPTLLAAADVLVSPTHYDAYGLAVHEALCCGVPVVVSRAAGVAERLTPPLTELVLRDPGDAGEVAGRLRAWQDGRDRYRAASLMLGDRLRADSWERMAERFLAVMNETP